MKQCPDCRRIYTDESLNYCLDDGEPLVYGPAEPATAILSSPGEPSDAPTRPIGTLESTVENDVRVTQPEQDQRNIASGRNRYVTAVVGVLLLAALGVGGYWLYAKRGDQQISSIAVLPFENESGNADIDYLSDGVSESVIDRLSQLPQLKVIARASSFQYRGPGLKLQDIANALGVEALVTGRVTQRGDSYLIRVEMTDPRANRNLWSATFNRATSDVQALQSDISREIAENLRLRLSGDQNDQLARSGTANPQAYETLLKGRFYNNKVGTENRKKAAEFFQQAIEIDPNYALAYAELSLVYTNLVGYSNYDPKEFMPKAEAAAQKALELDPDLAEAPYAMAAIERFKWNWAKAEQSYKHAIELNPNLARSHNGYALFLSVMGRHDEAIAEIKRARESDPVSELINLNMGVIYFAARRYDEAIDILTKTLELDANIPFAHIYLGLAYSEKAMHDKAIAEIEEAIKLNEGNPKTQIFLGTVYAKAGQTDKAHQILRGLETGKNYVSPAELAMLYAVLGDHQAALASIEKAFAEHDLQLQYVDLPAYDSLQSEPRFQDVVRRIGLTRENSPGSKNGSVALK